MGALFGRLLHANTVRQFVDAFNNAAAKHARQDDGEAKRCAEAIVRVEAEIDRMKNAILRGVDPTTFVDELSQRQAELRRLQQEAKGEQEDRTRWMQDANAPGSASS